MKRMRGSAGEPEQEVVGQDEGDGNAVVRGEVMREMEGRCDVALKGVRYDESVLQGGGVHGSRRDTEGVANPAAAAAAAAAVE